MKKELWQQNASAVQVFKTSLMEFLGREGYRRGGWVKGETFDGKQKIKENQVMRKKKKKGSLNRKGENDPGMSLPRQTLSQR